MVKMTNSNKSKLVQIGNTLDPRKVENRIQQAQIPKQPVEPKEKGSK